MAPLDKIVDDPVWNASARNYGGGSLLRCSSLTELQRTVSMLLAPLTGKKSEKVGDRLSLCLIATCLLRKFLQLRSLLLKVVGEEGSGSSPMSKRLLVVP